MNENTTKITNQEIMDAVGNDNFSRGFKAFLKPFSFSNYTDKDNTFTFWSSYYYRHNQNEDKLSQVVQEKLMAKGYKTMFLSAGDNWHAFVGGAKSGSAKDSFFWVVLKIERIA